MANSASIEKHDDDAALRVKVAQAAASLDAGHSISYEDVRNWLLSWGTDKEQPSLKCR